MLQGFHEESSAPKYPIGKRIKVGDWTYHYCRAITALFYHLGAYNGDPLHEQNTALVASAGDLDLTIVGNFTADQFKDGYINIWTTVKQVMLRIKGNDVGDGVNTVLHLKDPLLRDVALATFTDVHANIYNNVKSDGIGISNTKVSFVVVPLINVTINNYFWGLTYGPTIGTAHTGGGQGSGGNQRAVVFQDDGSIDIPSRVSGTTDAQPAGYLLPDTALGDDIFYMLQLAA